MEELKQTVVDLDNQVDELVFKQRVGQSDPGVPILPSPSLPQKTPIVEFDPLSSEQPTQLNGAPTLCRLSLAVLTANTDTDIVAKVSKARAEAIGAKEVITTPHHSGQGVVLNFQAPLSDAPAIQRWLSQDNLFSVSWINSGLFTVPELENKLADFAKLYPEQSATLMLSHHSTDPTIESTHAADLKQFAEQMFGLLPNATITIERTPPQKDHAGSRPTWRLVSVEHPPLLTQDNLLTAEAADDGDSPSIRIGLNPAGLTTLVEATSTHTGRKLTFVIGHDLLHTHIVHAPVLHGTIELPIQESVGPGSAQNQAKQLAGLLASGRYLSDVISAEYTDVQCPKAQ